ncbi:MAG TPA: FxLYD domain-containing protein [Bryobacteraceae bacterium]|nr:FxLYD domain-containing protein [Bryobacteraceae bacterium]
MRFVAAALLLLCFTASGRKAPDVTVVQTKARRVTGLVTLDGRVRNTGEKAINGLTLIFNFLSPENTVVTRQETGIDQDSLEPGQEASFHAELVDPVRAVTFTMEAQDHSQRSLRVANTGPFTIE